MDSPTPVAIVTGASNGIGRAIARDLARTHTVYAVGRDATRLGELAGAEASVVPVVADVTDEAALRALVSGLERLDVVVHSAALAHSGHLEDTTHDLWMLHLETNVVAPATLTRLALPLLRQSHGTVVFIGSGAGTRAHDDMSVYSASKFALRALADSVRLEEARNGVRVSTVAPGPVDTDMQRALQSHLGNEYEPARFIRPETVAQTVRFVVDAPPDAQLTDISVRPRA